MRRLFLMLLLPVALACAESESDIVAARIKKLETGVPKAHPRLLLQKSELVDFRAFLSKLRGTPEGEALWKKIAYEPRDQDLTPEPKPLPEKKGTSNSEVTEIWRNGYETANATGNIAWRSALQYLVTGDEKYGREAARWLMHLAAWRGDSWALRNNDEQFIQATRPMIFAYDWAYDALTPGERKTLENTLIERIGLLNRDQKRYFSLTKPTAPSNSLSHPMRFISTVGQGGLALFHEQADAPEYLAWAYEYYNRQFPVWGGEDGGWAEGLDYWSTGNSQHLRFLDGMKQLGFDEPLQRGFFRNNPYFGMFNLMTYPGSSFGDLTNITKPDTNRALLLEKYAVLNRDPYPLAFSRKLASSYPDGMSYYTFNAIDSLLHQWRLGQAKVPAANLADLPQSRYFADIGWVNMHSALGDKDKDIMLTLKSSPYGSASHSHNDQNAFVINAFGEPLAIQSGYRDWYDSAHHVGWTRLTQSKNAILIDGKGQPSKDADAKGRISLYRSGNGFTFATGDASPAYRKSADLALRHVFFIQRRYFVMLDEVEAKSNVLFQWLLHAREKMELEPKAASIVSSKGRASLQVNFLVPAADQLKFGQTDAFLVPLNAAFSKGRPNEWHVQAETVEAKSRGEFLTVLYPTLRGDIAANSVRLPASQGFALKVSANDSQDTILFSRAEAHQVRSEVGELDGVAAYVSRQTGQVSGFSLVETTLLRQGEIHVQASQKVTLEGVQKGNVLELQLQSHPALQLKLAMAKVPKSVSGLDAGSWHYDAPSRILVLDLAPKTDKVVIAQ